MLCSLVTSKDGKDHQQQKITVSFFSWKGAPMNVNYIIATSTRLPLSSTHVHKRITA